MAPLTPLLAPLRSGSSHLLLKASAGALALHAVGLVAPALLAGAPHRPAARPAARTGGGGAGSIDVVVAAYLEASVIGPTVRRLQRSLALHGPGRVIVVASDPATFEAAVDADVRVLGPRAGKAAAVNAGVALSDADLVVLTDANCTIAPEDWPQLARAALAGGVTLLSANKTEQGGDGLYWRYEALVKARASRRGGCLAVVGEFIAMRREDFVDLPVTAVNDDLWMAIETSRRGGRVEVHPAISTSEPPAPAEEQWWRRIRIMDGQLRLIWRSRGELLRCDAGRHLLAHKAYRSTVGAAAFWLAVTGGLALLRPLWALLAAATAVLALRDYRTGARRVPGAVRCGAVYLGLQAVPLEVAVRAATARLAGRSARQTHLWRKVGR